MNTLKKRRAEMVEYQDSPSELEKLYFTLGHDIAYINECLGDFYKTVQEVKIKIEPEYKSVAAQDRAFELTEEFLLLKQYKHTLAGLECLRGAIYVKLKGLKAEAKGQY